MGLLDVLDDALLALVKGRSGRGAFQIGGEVKFSFIKDSIRQNFIIRPFSQERKETSNAFKSDS